MIFILKMGDLGSLSEIYSVFLRMAQEISSICYKDSPYDTYQQQNSRQLCSSSNSIASSICSDYIDIRGIIDGACQAHIINQSAPSSTL